MYIRVLYYVSEINNSNCRYLQFTLQTASDFQSLFFLSSFVLFFFSSFLIFFFYFESGFYLFFFLFCHFLPICCHSVLHFLALTYYFLLRFGNALAAIAFVLLSAPHIRILETCWLLSIIRIKQL